MLFSEPLGRRAVFVDTCGSFNASRLASMMEAHVTHPGGDEAMEGYTEHLLHDALSRLTVVALHDLSALASWLADFDERHTARPPPAVLFLDSITAVAACVIGGTDAASAHALLGEVGRLLCRIARMHNIAVVVTNGTVSDWSSGDGCIMPALGSTWMPVPTVRAWISAAGSACSLLKSAHTLAKGVQ